MNIVDSRAKAIAKRRSLNRKESWAAPEREERTMHDLRDHRIA